MKAIIATPTLAEEVGGPAYSVRRTHESLCLASIESQLITRRRERGTVGLSEWAADGLANTDVVHNFGVWTPFNHRVSRLARRARVPEVICPMGMLEPWSLAQKPLKKRLAWLFYQKRNLEGAAALHATALSEREHLRALGIGIPIAVIPRAVDLPADGALNRSGSRERPERVLLFLSRIHPKKGLLELVGACSRLSRRNGWRVIVAGPDTQRHQADVVAAVKRTGLEDRFHFVGPVWGEAKTELFARSDLFVLPTHSENFGIVIAEALAHSLPVITTTSAPWAELAQFRCGWWMPTGADALAGAIEEALSVPNAVLAEMGSRGRNLIRERYSWPAVARLQIELYAWVSGVGPRPTCVID
jgi:glycosyltransferase involved in cell wall biosynthesis